MKIGSMEFDVIDTVTSCHEIAREIGIPLDAETSNTPLAIKLNGKIRLLQLMKHDIEYAEEMNTHIALEDYKPQGKKQIAKMKRKFNKTLKEAYAICRELGWIK